MSFCKWVSVITLCNMFNKQTGFSDEEIEVLISLEWVFIQIYRRWLRLCVEILKRNNRNIHAHKRLPYRFGMVEKKYLFHFWLIAVHINTNHTIPKFPYWCTHKCKDSLHTIHLKVYSYTNNNNKNHIKVICQIKNCHVPKSTVTY